MKLLTIFRSPKSVVRDFFTKHASRTRHTILLLTAICSLLPAIISAQVYTAWIRRYNGPRNYIDRAKAIAVDVQGNVYVTGNKDGFDSYADTLTDYATIKYNPNGVQQWVALYNGPRDSADYATAIAVDGSGNAYVTGLSYGLGTAGDYTTIKYNSFGETLWVRRYMGTLIHNTDEARAIAVDGSGNVYVTGGSIGPEGWGFATIKYNPSGETLWVRRYVGSLGANAMMIDNSGNVYVTGDFITIKYSSSGVEQWAVIYDGPGVDISRAIAVDGSGNVYVTGLSWGSGSAYDYATIKYNSLGETLWVRRYNGPGNGWDLATAIGIDDSGNVCVTGMSIGANNSNEYATIKYNASGDTLWVRRYSYGAGYYAEANAIALDDSGNVYVTGQSSAPGTFGGYATVKYNAAGVQQWVVRYVGPGNGDDEANAIRVDNLGNVYVTGRSMSAGPNNYDDYATIKYINSPLPPDVGCTQIVTPSGTIDSIGPIIPQARVGNYGTNTETFNVTFRIGASYIQTRPKTLSAGIEDTVNFPAWVPVRGTYTTRCSTYLAGDVNRTNDTLSGSVTVRVRDVGVTQIVTPAGTIDSTGSIAPQARVRNYGTNSETFNVTFRIGASYIQTRPKTLSAGIEDTVNFPAWVPVRGTYTTRCSTYLANDVNRTNDTISGSVTVQAPTIPSGWQTMAQIPTLPSDKKPKSGSCMTGLNNKIYLLKASNTQDFHIYTPDAGLGTWTSDTMPVGSKETGDGKKPKKGASITGLGNSLFVLRGNNTPGFWKYKTAPPESIGWYKLANITTGLKNPKDASGLVAVNTGGTDYIFAMKGSKTDEFYLYDILTNTWAPTPTKPTAGTSGKIGYKKGSCLCYDGNNLVYVLKGSYGDFFSYNLVTNTWTELKRYDYKLFINRDGRKKKIGEGSGLIYYNNFIYLLKGGNTLEFWLYDIAQDSFIQMGPATTWDIPPGSGKKVKGGGCLTKLGDNFYAAKGANTPEFYKHSVPTTSIVLIPNPTTNNEGTMADKMITDQFSLSITPNPVIDILAVNYHMLKAELVNIKLYNVCGKLVKFYNNPKPTKDGLFSIDTKSFPSGIYILRFNSGDINYTKKVILEK